MNPNEMTGPADDEISLLDLVATVAANLKLLILAPLLVGLAVLGVSFLLPSVYTAQTKILPLSSLDRAASTPQNPAEQFMTVLRSRAIQDQLIERFSLTDHYQAPSQEAAARALVNNTRISSGRDGFIGIEFDDSAPAFAAQVANAYVDEVRLLMLQLAQGEAQQRRKFFEQHLQQVKAPLAQAEQALLASGINVQALDIQQGSALQAVAQLRAEVAAQEVEVLRLRARHTGVTPELQEALDTLSDHRRQLNLLTAQNPVTDAGAGGSSANAAHFALLQDFTFQQAMFDLMAKQYEMARVDEARESAVLQVLDVAQPPEQRSSPQRALIAVLATLASGFALLLFVFVRQALRSAQQDPDSAAKIAAIRRSLGLRG